MDALDANVNNVGTVKFPNVGAVMTSPPTGGLSGRMSIINAAVGTNFSYDATALDAAHLDDAGFERNAEALLNAAVPDIPR